MSEAEYSLPTAFVEGLPFDPYLYDFSKSHTRVDVYAEFNKDDVIAAMLVTGANFAQMASLLGRSRAKVYDFVHRNVGLVAVLRDIQETLLDFMEHGLKVNALQGDSADRRYALSTLGKERGYSSRSEMTGAGGGPVSVANVVDASSLTPEQREALRGALMAAKEASVDTE